MGRKKKDVKIINIDELGIEKKVVIDYDELARAIAKAKEIEKKNEEKEKAAAFAKWMKEIGYNEHADKKGLIKTFFRTCNEIKVLWNIMFISKKKHIAISPTISFFQYLTSSFFSLIKWLLTALSICFIIVIFCHPGMTYDATMYFKCGVFALLSFMLARMFRLMVIEIDQMSDREQILGIFTALVAVIPLAEEIVELFKGVG